jgi:hypothetical protein
MILLLLLLEKERIEKEGGGVLLLIMDGWMDGWMDGGLMAWDGVRGGKYKDIIECKDAMRTSLFYTFAVCV